MYDDQVDKYNIPEYYYNIFKYVQYVASIFTNLAGCNGCENTLQVNEKPLISLVRVHQYIVFMMLY